MSGGVLLLDQLSVSMQAFSQPLNSISLWSVTSLLNSSTVCSNGFSTKLVVRQKYDVVVPVCSSGLQPFNGM